MAWFPCQRCRLRRGLLIRGLCTECAPDLHDARERQCERVAALMSDYERVTGGRVVDDYLAFEAWAGLNAGDFPAVMTILLLRGE